MSKKPKKIQRINSPFITYLNKSSKKQKEQLVGKSQFLFSTNINVPKKPDKNDISEIYKNLTVEHFSMNYFIISMLQGSKNYQISGRNEDADGRERKRPYLRMAEHLNCSVFEEVIEEWTLTRIVPNEKKL